VHTLSEVSLWDTVPEGLAITGTSLLPSVQSGRFIAWAPANLGAVSGNVIALYCQVQPGIRKAGNTLQNTAYAKANDMYNNNYYEEANVSVETQGPVISSVIEAVPATVNQGQHFTVFMTVSNSGNAPAIMVMPGQPLSAAGTGTCSNVSGPNPAYYSSLAEGSSVIFTWVYSANTQGVIYFTGNATAKENGFDISSYVSASNPVSVYVFPTASRTPTMTSTNTPEITLTLTLEATHTVTAGMPYPTGTMTVTEQTATATPTATEILVYPTATCTVTVKIPTPAPSATPLDTVYVDRNYANPGKGEKFTVYFKVPSAGTLEITVYNLSGEKIRQFKKEYTAATSDSVEWDGRNEDGRTAGRGIYFISVRLGKWQEMRKVVVLK
ncbi:MAG TPA: T9SS type A sorting domain-containing protein, partial [Candidatus Goldiibacteriota bacterium]|nr:T9SS type A sorting domain-containing protein [Candidatus Goldiibacteriota bacterium]